MKTLQLTDDEFDWLGITILGREDECRDVIANADHCSAFQVNEAKSELQLLSVLRGKAGFKTEDEYQQEISELTRDMLLLVDVHVGLCEIDSWSKQQRDQAEEWAVAVHAKASDNHDVEVPPKPAFLPPSETELSIANRPLAILKAHFAVRGAWPDRISPDPVNSSFCVALHGFLKIEQ